MEKEERLIRKSGIFTGSPTVELHIVTHFDSGSNLSEVRYLKVSRKEWDAIHWVLNNMIHGANLNSSIREDGQQ